jgi:O-succinylbenzoic acid--CoA ligase
VGAIGDDGRLRVAGRLDEAIRTGGETVWPHEVERALAGHPRVAEVAVVGRPDPEWGEQVAAFVVPHLIDDPPTLEDLREHGAATLPRYALPKTLMLVASLPRTPNGKVRRAELG